MFLQTRDGVYLDLHYSDPTNLVVPPKDYLGRNMREILPPELAAKFGYCFQRAIATGQPQRIEYELTIKGERRWYESRVVCCGENILSVVRDITERREAERALSESERRLRLAQQAARVGTWEWRLQTGESVWSDMIWELLGLERREGPVHVDNFVAFIHPDDRERVLTKVNEVIASGDEYYDEFRIVRPDGRVFWLSSQGRVFRSANGTPERMVGVNIDVSRRKLAEETALQTEQKDTAILNAIPDLMFLQTRDGVYLDYHAKNAKDLLVPPEEFLGKSMWDVLPADLATKFAGGFERAELSNEPQLVEYRLPMNGGECWYEARIVRSGENVLSVVRDITERKQALDELQRSEERFAKAFRANPQPMTLTVLHTGQYLDVNDSFLAVSGYSREELIGHTSLELHIWERPEARSDFVRRVEQGGSVVNVETLLCAKDGARHILLSSAELVDLGGERCLLIASSDITERKLAQEALQESEARFRDMADNAPVLIWISDTENERIYVNQQWLDFTGRTIEQDLGHGWTDGIHPRDRDECLKTYSAAFQARKPFRLEYRLRRADDAFRWVIDSGTPRFSATQEFLGYIGSCVDITSRKNTEEALEKAHEDLVVAHDEVSRLKNQLEAENIYLREEIRSDQMFGEMVGESDAIKYVLFKVSHVAITDSTVLITGETGTGKELVARAIHTASLRSDRPLITVNCAVLPSSLIESELFGYEKGAFTGATARKLGRFELADGGTIFLDEIGELPLESQVKLLRVLQEGEIERLGGAKAIKVDVRIIAATNRNLKDEIEKGSFREDLWYRLNVFPITVPPLRQRKEDIPLLVEHFVSFYAKKFGKKITSISPRTLQSFQAHTWPGNIRELANVIERAVIYTAGTALHVVDVFEPAREQPETEVKRLEEVEREYIVNILTHTGWRIEGPNGAAKLLGLNPSTLRTRMLKLGIHKKNANGAG
jgi:PAS domain S-box-containing protein